MTRLAAQRFDVGLHPDVSGSDGFALDVRRTTLAGDLPKAMRYCRDLKKEGEYVLAIGRGPVGAVMVLFAADATPHRMAVLYRKCVRERRHSPSILTVDRASDLYVHLGLSELAARHPQFGKSFILPFVDDVVSHTSETAAAPEAAAAWLARQYPGYFLVNDRLISAVRAVQDAYA